MHEALVVGSEPRWTPIVSHTVTAESIDLLLADEVPYLRGPKFLPADWCEEVRAAS
ncbi:Hypothetical protein A7982_05171 [Minicystis rosea]|nr:Hypothetical protein A7982_05171 [Minicystis rosea]